MIALSMICTGIGDEVRTLERALKSVAPFVDARFITLTGPEDQLEEAKKVCDTYNCQVSYFRPYKALTQEHTSWLTTFLGFAPSMKEGEQIFLFDEARNFNLNLIPKEYDWIFWMDADDVLRNGANLKLLAAEGLKKGVEAFYFRYLYQVELDGKGQISHVIIEHLRERLLRNIGVYKWIAPIHETLIEQRNTVKTDSDACDVVHLATQQDREASLQRNLKSLEYSIYVTQGKDPRPIYYLAKAYFDLNTPDYTDKAIKLIELYLSGDNPSGWPEERAQAWEYMAELYRRKGQLNNAVKGSLNAFTEPCLPQPTIFVNMAISFMAKHQWEQALFWAKLATQVPQNKTTLVVNPKDLQARTLEVIYNCCLQLGRVDQAWAAAQKLAELFPEIDSIKGAFQFIDGIRVQRDLTKEVTHLANYLRQSGEVAKIQALLHALPDTIKDNPFMVNLYQQNNPPQVWGDKDIVIYCGQGFTNWSPKRLTDPQGSFVGGSEEAVIMMAEALQRQGWKVTVYGDPGPDEGEYSGVKWLPYYKFNRNDHFNILIAWRDIRFFETKFDAKKKYLWCHDIQPALEYSETRVANVDKVFFLSKWHYENDRELMRRLPKEKTFFTSNGVL